MCTSHTRYAFLYIWNVNKYVHLILNIFTWTCIPCTRNVYKYVHLILVRFLAYAHLISETLINMYISFSIRFLYIWNVNKYVHLILNKLTWTCKPCSRNVYKYVHFILVRFLAYAHLIPETLINMYNSLSISLLAHVHIILDTFIC
jgi:hypothetical protein